MNESAAVERFIWTLSEQDRATCLEKAKTRYKFNRRHKIRDAVLKPTDEPWRADYEAFCAETAINHFIGGRLHDKNSVRGDGGYDIIDEQRRRYQVKFRRKRGYEFAVPLPRERAMLIGWDIGILAWPVVEGECETVEFIGWLTAEDWQSRAVSRSMTVESTAYLTDELRPPAELLEVVIRLTLRPETGYKGGHGDDVSDQEYARRCIERIRGLFRDGRTPD